MAALPIFFRFQRGVLVFLLLAQVAQAQPDFSTSEILPERGTVVAGEVGEFVVKLRNQGEEAAEGVEVTLQSPAMGYLLEVAGLEAGALDPESGDFRGKVTLPARGEKEVRVSVLAPREEAGAVLVLTVRAVHYDSMAETWLHGRLEVDARPRQEGAVLGGLRVTTAGLLVLGWLGATVAVVLTVAWWKGRRRAGRVAGSVVGALVLMIALGFWLIFAAMAWHDYRVLFHWRESMGTIVGRRVTIETLSSQQRLSGGATSQTRQSEVAKPEFALRYRAAGQERLSTGYDTGSSLRVGGGKAQLEREFQEWTVGAQVPCWYDPEDPDQVVLKRGFGGAYVFALLPLFPFWIGWRMLG